MAALDLQVDALEDGLAAKALNQLFKMDHEAPDSAFFPSHHAREGLDGKGSVSSNFFPSPLAGEGWGERGSFIRGNIRVPCPAP